jgi:hypothetical protein
MKYREDDHPRSFDKKHWVFQGWNKEGGYSITDHGNFKICNGWCDIGFYPCFNSTNDKLAVLVVNRKNIDHSLFLNGQEIYKFGNFEYEKTLDGINQGFFSKEDDFFLCRPAQNDDNDFIFYRVSSNKYKTERIEPEEYRKQRMMVSHS